MLFVGILRFDERELRLWYCVDLWVVGKFYLDVVDVYFKICFFMFFFSFNGCIYFVMF